jgi:hypothetical protein
MGSTVELEPCFELTRDIAHLRGLRSWMEARLTAYSEGFYYFSNGFFCGDALSVFF